MPLNLDPKANSATHGLGNTDYEDGVPKWGSAKFNGTMNLLIEVLDNGQTFRFDANSVNEIIIGRKDPQSVADNTPSIDLTTSEGLSKGVSRRHATIVRRDGALHIVDNNSANGTYLNGQRLVSGQPRILRDGDDIRLGHLVMRVNFRAGQATP
jgi:pSer/pThr/pTyr-binding forkhead associated (FHA) protein